MAPAVKYSLIFLFVNFGPQGTLWLHLLGIVYFFRLSISGLKGTLAAAVACCLIFLSVNFGPQGTLWLQLPGIV